MRKNKDIPGNNKYNRIIIKLILTLLLLCLSGCSSKNTSSKNKIYTSAQIEFDFLVDAISKRDNEKIKEKFSEYAINEIDNIDEKIERLISEFPGYEGELEITDTFSRHSNYGKITNIYTPSFDFVVNNETYRLRIIYYVEADEDPSKIGWYSVQLYKRGDPTYSSNMYTHDVKDEPDILLWDYTKDK